MSTDHREPETHEILIGEAAVVYCADFSNEPAVAAGETMSNPHVSVTNGTSLVTFGAATILSADFHEYDKNGNIADTVVSGKGVKFPATAGTAKGQCTATVTAVLSGGSTVARQVTFRVR